MAISRELTQKVKRTDSDEEDEEDEILLKNKENKTNLESEIDDFLKSCREYYDKKRETQGAKIEGDEISNEILSEKEKKALCLKEKDDTSQAGKSDIKSKLQSKKKGHADTNAVKSNSCNNEENNTLQTNINNTKSKLQKEKKSKKKSGISESSDIKDKSCSNKKDSRSLANTNDVKEQTGKKRKNKESVKSVDATNKHNKNKKLKSQDVSEMFDSEGSKKKGSKKSKVILKVQEEENEDYLPNLEFEDPKRKPILDSPLEETTSRKEAQKDSDLKSFLKTIANNIVQESDGISHEVEIDPKKYVNIKPKYLKTHLPDVTTGGDEDSEQEEETHKIMSEAFADDDVVEEFRKEKEEEVCKQNFKVKTIFPVCIYINISTTCLCFEKNAFSLNLKQIIYNKYQMTLYFYEKFTIIFYKHLLQWF